VVDGRRISYVDVGDGPTVLLLHGLGHSTHGWRKVIAPIASAGYRVMAVDLPGFGYSDRPGDYSLAHYIDFVAHWLDLHCIERAALIGNSMGGAITAAFAGTHPERAAAAVLVDPGGFGREVSWLLRLAGLRVVRSAMGLRVSAWQVRRALRLIFADPSRIEDEDVRRILEINALPGARQAFLEIARGSIGLRGVRPDVALGEVPGRITAATLIIWGDRDRIIPVSHAELAHRAIPHSQVVIFERCGHVPQLEMPERFTDEVLRFFRTSSPAG
jgi:pimeloyl-ACP methyl ester carboxylesterase